MDFFPYGKPFDHLQSQPHHIPRRDVPPHTTLRRVIEAQGEKLEGQEELEHWGAKGQTCPQRGQCSQRGVTDPKWWQSGEENLGEEKTKRIERARRAVVDGDEADGEAGRQVDLGSREQQPGRQMEMNHCLGSMQQTSPSLLHLTLCSPWVSSHLQHQPYLSGCLHPLHRRSHPWPAGSTWRISCSYPGCWSAAWAASPRQSATAAAPRLTSPRWPHRSA